jgi:antibiotic biosynthesis monooxygenase (ABM) superfamily enzyme
MADTENYVSIIVDREILPGKKDEFEEAMKGIINASKAFPGYLGTDIHAPQNPSDHLYRVVFSFRKKAEFKVWEQSKERQYWVGIIDEIIKEPSKLQVISGLETWFALPRVTALVPPKRYKMAVVTWLAITPLLMLFNYLTTPIFGKLHPMLRILASTPIIVILMTYLIMPNMAKWFAKWLYPTQCNK